MNDKDFYATLIVKILARFFVIGCTWGLLSLVNYLSWADVSFLAYLTVFVVIEISFVEAKLEKVTNEK